MSNVDTKPTSPPTVPTPMAPNVFEIKEKIAKLQETILASHPTLPVLLRQIHTQLRTDPELVSCLEEEEIGIIVNGLKKQTNTEIATAATKKSGTSTAALVKKAAASKGGLLDML